MPFDGLFWLVMVRTLSYILQGTSGRLGSRLLAFLPIWLPSFSSNMHRILSWCHRGERVPDEGRIARLVFVFFCLFADEEAEGPNNQGKHSPQFAQTPGGAI